MKGQHIMGTKPFFSLVIPCYNDGSYTEGAYLDRLLQSVCEQDIRRKDIELILVDDHSPVSYDDIIAKYRKKKFKIKTIQTDYNFGPGNSREKGTEIAEGEWLCFADHDDAFYPKALKRVKEIIEKSGATFVVYSSFDKVDMETGEVVEEFRKEKLHTWIHGKFYNLENFWKRCQLHFPKDLKTHEDIAMGNEVKCALHALGDPSIIYVESPTYRWSWNPDSISHSEYYSEKAQEEHPFLESHFDDYLRAGFGVYFDRFKIGQLNRNALIGLAACDLCNTWVLLARWKMKDPEYYVRANDVYMAKVWKEIKDLTELTAPAMKVFITDIVKEPKKKFDEIAAQNNIPDIFEWLDNMDKLIEENPEFVLPEEPERPKPQPEPEVVDEDDRPFFSIIIPCYNDGRYKEGNYLDRLLSSLCRQEIGKDELEVIISDDHSPVGYDEIVDKYHDKLNIKRIVTDYNFAPGNTRAKGVTIATGQWLAFADHDDIYYDGALKRVKDSIHSRNEKYFVFSAFNGVDLEGKVIRKYDKVLNWCHGKFYNFDNFWKPNNIHFVKDLKSHEDIAICTQVGCALANMGQTELTYISEPTYAWTDNPESVSHAKYTVETDDGPREFLEVFFKDYITSTGYMYIDKFKEHNIKIMYAVRRCLEILCYCYFYMQGFQFRRPIDFYRPNLAHAGHYFRAVKETFNITTEQAFMTICENNAQLYYNVIDMAAAGAGHYIPIQTLRQWMDLIDNYAREDN